MSPEPVKLAVERVVAAGENAIRRRAVFLHGILGSGSNLKTLARQLVQREPGLEVWLVDLRGHGRSPKNSPMPSLVNTALDVVSALSAQAMADRVPLCLLLGHSFGGKIALRVAQLLHAEHTAGRGQVVPWSKPLHVVTLDTNPAARTLAPTADSPLAVLDVLDALPTTFDSVAGFVAALVGRGIGQNVAMWLAKSTERTPDNRVRFGLDTRELRSLLSDYLATDQWSVLESPPEDVWVHLVIGEHSVSYPPADRVRAQTVAQRSPSVTSVTLATDHWVHTDDPTGVLRVLLGCLAQK